ncbi:hypothetical protein [Pleionea litopenaei]|uniref:Uncharacterized protein n=1 Tax=Pleionea litopenaei TaxID=3070815 RepID=A0AA51X7G5_9GAMM|nr:hypothetical protein [Pleionea sp. HL-JVS1]WMS87894.1 hypothetical protein Q9312_02980 [Pleionea sp. HL-JVS1]
MKDHYEKFDTFLNEQKSFFNEELANTCSFNWEGSVWIGGTQTSGWLAGNRKTPYRFDKGTRIKGIGTFKIEEINYQHFM